MKPKKYSNHTGKVNYMDINCEVESATFELLKETKLFKNKIEIVAIFHSGTITGGRLKNIIVNDGLIKDSMATGAIFYGGTFSGSTLGFSIWYYILISFSYYFFIFHIIMFCFFTYNCI